MKLTFVITLTLLLIMGGFSIFAVDSPPAEDQVGYTPEDGGITDVNPPSFVWVPGNGFYEYTLQYSTDPEFESEQTVTLHNLEKSVYTPYSTLEPGTWYWRYGFEKKDDEIEFSKIREFIIPEDAEPFPRPKLDDVLGKISKERPRLYFPPDKVKKIREDKTEISEEHIDSIVGQAENIVARGDPLFPEPKPWEEYEDSRQAYIESFNEFAPFTWDMETVAMAYVYTGKEKFAKEAKRRLLHLSNWDVDGPSSVYHPSELGMAIAARAPRTFDWIYEYLTEDERETCVEFLGERIAQINELHRNMPFESRPFSSHPGRMIGFAIEGSIILAHEVTEAKEWLDYTLHMLWSVYPAWGGADGGWHEGVSYWGAYMRKIIPVISELERLGIPITNKPFFKNTGYFGLYAVYPHRQHSAFGDGYENSVSSSEGNLMYILASLYDNPYFWWYTKEMDGEPYGSLWATRYQSEIEVKPPYDLPQARKFSEIGLTAMHSYMSSPDNNVLMLFQSNPYGSISHNHASQNAFVLEAFTEPLAISSGYYQEYGSPHHEQWVNKSRAHNTILVDGEGQIPRNAEAAGKITDFKNTPEVVYTVGDAEQAYGEKVDKFDRHVLFSRGLPKKDPETLVNMIKENAKKGMEKARADYDASESYDAPWMDPDFKEIANGDYKEAGYNLQEAFHTLAYILTLDSLDSTRVNRDLSQIIKMIKNTKLYKTLTDSDRNYFVIYDELESSTPSIYQWLMHAQNEMKLEDENNSLIVEKGKAYLKVQFLYPEKLEFQQKSGFDPEPVNPDEASDQFHFQASTVEKKENMKFITVLFPRRSLDKIPETSLQEVKGGVVIKVGEDIIALKDAKGKKVKTKNLESQAKVAVIQRDSAKKILNVFTYKGNKVIWNGEEL